MEFNKSYVGGIHRENSTTRGGSYLETAAAARAGVEASAAQPRRRSHRPRGCRGGRKNRKNRERNAAVAAAAATGSSVALTALATSKSQPNSNTSHININHTTNNSPLKGDLSNFQHVNTRKAWGGNQHSPLPKSDHNNNNSPMKRQMLPPPLPPFLNGHDPFVEKKAEEQADDRTCLKMLPSFDERELTSFLSAPVASSSSAAGGFLSTSPFQQPLDLRHLLSGSDGIPLGTMLSTSSGSGSDDDYSTSTSHCKHQRIEMQRHQELESGSLFVTSPRSFLLGAPSSSNQSQHQNNISVW